MSQSLLFQFLLDDLVYEILTWVPVKSLIRFRCVSKSWYSTITSHKFIKTHLDRAKSSSNNNNYLLYKSQRMSSSLNELCTVVHNSDRTLSEISRLQIPDYYIFIVGFCNGMFLSADDDSDYGHVVYLWNPSIRKYKKLPPSHFIHTFGPSYYCFTFGLAYHYQNNDYKILKIFYDMEFLQQKVMPAEAEVYTLSTDSWRRFKISVESSSGSRPIGSVDYLNESSLLFFNGALHSIACSEGYKFILSFDVNDERFREILLPQNYLDGVSLRFEALAVFKGSLTLFVFGVSNLCHLWIMKEYGVVESWTKKTIQRKEAAEFFDCIVDGTCKGERYTFWPFWRLSFDPESLNKEIFRIPNAGCMINATNFVESLVLLDGINISQE
nr:F-box/kelch-repeat protein At3g23880-like [Quercus suber]